MITITTAVGIIVTDGAIKQSGVFREEIQTLLESNEVLRITRSVLKVAQRLFMSDQSKFNSYGIKNLDNGDEFFMTYTIRLATYIDEILFVRLRVRSGIYKLCR